MKKLKTINRLVVLLIIFASLIFIKASIADPAFAADGSGAEIIYGPTVSPGKSQRGSDCPSHNNDTGLNQWRIDCAGVSWVYYAVQDVSKAAEITFPYIQGNPSNTTVPRTCSEHENGGFWHYGVNLRGAGLSQDYGGGIYNNLGVYGHWSTRRFGEFAGDFSAGVYVPLDSKLNQTVGNGLYKATTYVAGATIEYDSNGNVRTDYRDKTGTRSNVVRDFIAAWAAKNDGEVISEAVAVDKLTDGVGIFCWWDGMAGTQFYAKSYASNRTEAQSTGANDWVDTDVVNAYTEKSTEARRVNIGEKVAVTFTHNVYASKAETDINWKVERTVNDGSFVSSNYTITPLTGTNESKGDITPTTSGIAKSHTENDSTGLYIGKPQDYTDGTKYYLLRDYYTFTFSTAGTYNICESAYIDNNKLTKVCSKIEVVDENTRLFYSNTTAVASNSDFEDATTTGINQNVEADILELTIRKGTTLSLSFYHDMFSNKDGRYVSSCKWTGDAINGGYGRDRDYYYADRYNNYDWYYNGWHSASEWQAYYRWLYGPDTVTAKNGDICPNNSSFHNYDYDEVNYRIERSGDFSTIGSSESTNVASGKVKLSERQSASSEYYTAPAASKSYTYNGAKYLHSETFSNKTFNTVGTFTFCETIWANDPSLANTAKVYTKACIKIEVTSLITPEICKKWAPDAYNNSNRFSGQTFVVSAIKNNSLAGDYSAVVDGDSSIFAKPGDVISWVNCYYPGVQELANDRLVGLNGAETISGKTAHGAESGCSCTSNTYESFKNLIEWTNKFKMASTTDAARNGIFSAPSGWQDYILGEWQTYPALTSPTPFDQPTNHKYFSRNYTVNLLIGRSDAKLTNNDYSIKATNDVGNKYEETISTPGTPYKATYWTESHSWSACCGCGCCSGEDCSCACCNTTVYHCSSYSAGTSESGERKSTSIVEIPYNFINTTAVKIQRGSKNLVYAGDAVTIEEASVTVGQKRNSNVGNANYATQVDNARIALVAYVSAADETTTSSYTDDGVTGRDINDLCATSYLADKKQCMVVQDNKSDAIVLNYDNSVEAVKAGGTERDQFKLINSSDNDVHYTAKYETTYNVFDASAGDYMCFAMMLYPAASGADNNLDASGNNKWAVSKSCIIIAKKPSVQILGNNFFSAGNVASSISRKHNLFAISNYVSGAASGLSTATSPVNSSTYFGSWAEEALFSNGLVTNFASGAAIGLNGETANGRKLYGADNNNYCDKWVPLSFANYTGSNSISICGNSGSTASGKANLYSGTEDRAALIDYIASGTKVEGTPQSSYGFGDYYTIASGSNKTIHYTETSGNLTINGGNVLENTTIAVKVSGDATITGNIIYDNDSDSNAGYTSMTNLPQVVIYASGNIHIACGVSRIDAILVAGNIVYTCSKTNADGVVEEDYLVTSATDLDTISSSDINAIDRSLTQLTINGAIIANKIELARTYGNAIGVESGTPAEIINFDTSSLVWGRSMADAGESDTLTTVYVHELAPRY